MRFLLLLALAGSPALAEGPPYDAKILPACLDRTAESSADARVCIGEAATQCMARPGGDTTVGMVDCLSAEAKDWDSLMNGWYGKAMQQAEALDAEMKSLGSAAEPAAPVLKQAQRDWIAFRDSSCKFQSIRYQGGTAGGPAAATCLMQMTGEQALHLRELLEDAP